MSEERQTEEQAESTFSPRPIYLAIAVLVCCFVYVLKWNG